MEVFAVIGLGSIAKRHISNLRSLHPTAKIFAVSATGRNKKLPKGADAILSLDELIACQPKYVIVASPAPFHIEVAKTLLVNNIAVLIEKPLAESVENCESLLEFYTDKMTEQVAVGYCLRFMPSARVVKSYLDKGALGKLYNVHASVGQYLPTWRSDKSYKNSVSAKRALGGGVLLELSHELDLLYWFLGDLSLHSSRLQITDELDLDVEDIANLTLISKEAVYISLHLDFIQKSPQRYAEFIGQYGRLYWDLIHNSVTLFDSTGSEVLYSDPNYDKNKMYKDMLIEFERLSNRKKTALASLESATKIVKIIQDAKSLNNWSAHP